MTNAHNDNSNMNMNLEASISLLIMSIASNAMMAMGLTPDPQTGKTEIDKSLAKFNIDLLAVIKTKTAGNLNAEESALIEHILTDLKAKFIQLK